MSDLTDNEARQRYEMVVDGETAFVTYARHARRLTLLHTEVPQALAGRGVGSTLARAVLNDVRRRGLLLVPECEFIRQFVERHPEFADLTAGPDAPS